MPIEKMHSVRAIAEMTDASHWTVRGWFKRGLKKRKIGGKVFVFDRDLQEFIAKSTSTAATAAKETA